MSDIQEFIINYIKDNAVHGDELVTPDTNFVETGLLDSFAILNLIMTLESQYNIKFAPQEFADPALRVVATLAEITQVKME